MRPPVISRDIQTRRAPKPCRSAPPALRAICFTAVAGHRRLAQRNQYAFDSSASDGVVVECNHNGVYLGDRKLDPVFEELNRSHAKVFIHPTNPHCACCQDPTALPPIGYPFPMLEFMFETTRAVFNLILSGTLNRFPNLKIIVPHAGAVIPILADRVAGLSPALGSVEPLDLRSSTTLAWPLLRPRRFSAAPPDRSAAGHRRSGSTSSTAVTGLIRRKRWRSNSPRNSTRVRCSRAGCDSDIMRNNALTLFPALRRGSACDQCIGTNETTMETNEA